MFIAMIRFMLLLWFSSIYLVTGLDVPASTFAKKGASSWWAIDSLHTAQMKCPFHNQDDCLQLLLDSASSLDQSYSGLLFYAVTSIEMSGCGPRDSGTPCLLNWTVVTHPRLWVSLCLLLGILAFGTLLMCILCIYR